MAFALKRSTRLHLRLPFSYFLLPVFLLGVALLHEVALQNVMLVGFILHSLIYPASNGYNSYFDRDEGSIGGLEKPPPVSKELFYVSWMLDILAIVIGWVFLGWEFAAMAFVYGMISKAYSHPLTRLKKHPIVGWLAAGVFQGYFTLLMAVVGIAGWHWSLIMSPMVQYAGILSTLLLFGSYPMTQVYQHEEDARRGDRTISLLMGVKGTFHFTALAFALSTVLFVIFFFSYFNGLAGGIFLLMLSPVLVFFAYWYMLVRKDIAKANFRNTMRLNLISATALNAFFLWLAIACSPHY